MRLLRLRLQSSSCGRGLNKFKQSLPNFFQGVQYGQSVRKLGNSSGRNGQKTKKETFPTFMLKARCF